MSNKPKRRPSHSSRIAEAADARRSRTGLIIGLVAGAVVIALVMALLLSRGSEEITATEPTVEAGTAALPEYPPPAADGTQPADPAVGRPAPIVSGEQFDGAPITLPDSGRPAVIVFLAHWCPHCQAEVPRIVADIEANGMPDDVDLFGVATANDPSRPNYPPDEWLEGERWTIPTLVDKGNSAAELYGLSGFPYFVVVDAEGNVVERVSGELSIEAFNNLIEAARTGTPSPITQGPSSPR